MSDYDPAVMDPLEVDTEPPPFRDLFKIESGGDQMNARLYVAQGLAAPDGGIRTRPRHERRVPVLTAFFPRLGDQFSRQHAERAGDEPESVVFTRCAGQRPKATQQGHEDTFATGGPQYPVGSMILILDKVSGGWR